eukprot:12578318-Alexandrium_andersonii.AAC.1
MPRGIADAPEASESSHWRRNRTHVCEHMNNKCPVLNECSRRLHTNHPKAPARPKAFARRQACTQSV